MHNHSLPHQHGQEIEKICDHMPQLQDFQVVSDIFKQMGDSTPCSFFWFLFCEMCHQTSQAMMEMSSPAVSHHLKQLKIQWTDH